MDIKNIINKKNILLISPVFFGYEKAIESELRAHGANVYFLSDRPYKNTVLRALTNKLPSISSFVAEWFYYRKCLKIFDVDFDYVFVINGQTCSLSFISFLRKNFRKSKFLLYFWDSVSNRPNSKYLADYFDKVLTFDAADSSAQNWIFRPLFFTSEYSLGSAGEVFTYGLSFIATAHSDRVRVAEKVFSQIPRGILVFKYFYLQSPWVYYIYKFVIRNITNSRISDFKFAPLDRIENKEIFANSACILDVEHPKQSGLTIRTFEALGAGKKIITTNASIRDYDFYNEHNVCIIDRQDPVIPMSFFTAPYVNLPEEIYKRYSIRGWIAEIFKEV